MTQFSIPLNIPNLELVSQRTDSKGHIYISVVSSKHEVPCKNCGKPATKRNGTSPELKIRHLPVFDTPVFLLIRPVRYQCQHCDNHTNTVEKYDWCDQKSRISKALEEYLMRRLISSTISDVSRKESISYKKVVSALERQVSSTVDWSQYTSLNTLGIDEISLKKGHKDYLTIISARSETGDMSILAVLEGRLKETIKSFLESIPQHLKKTVKSVCTDMYDGFVNAVVEVFGIKVLVIDRYHVAKLYRAPLDKLRISEMKRLKNVLSAKDYSELDGMMWILRKKHECLSQADKWKLALLYQYSPDLKEAHQFALKLTHIMNTHSSKKSATAKIYRWITAVKKRRLTCFKGFVATLEKYKHGITNYFIFRKNSGFVEGLNNKIKVIKRRCYGILKPETLFQRIFLDLKGYELYV